MYALLWRLLPGSTVVKALEALALVALVIWLLLFHVFPAVEPHLPFDRITVGE